MSCHVHVSFIAVNVRNNLQPCQRHWYDVYLIQTHIPLRILQMTIKAIILSVRVSFPEAKVSLENCSYATHHAELAGLSILAFLLEIRGSPDSK